MKFHPCRITVIKKELYKDLVNSFVKNPNSIEKCKFLKENQEFIVKNPYNIPENMCASAWADIRTYIITMATGGEFDFMINTESTLAICADPFRPVIFMIERLQNG